jgi:hypothetical protein
VLVVTVNGTLIGSPLSKLSSPAILRVSMRGKFRKIGQTKQEVESVWGKPDRSRVNSDRSSAELFVPDK